MKDRTLITNGHVLTMDPALGNFEKADVLIEGGNIVAVQSNLDIQDGEVIDATNMIVMPGFIDTHRHLWESQLRALGADWTLQEYFRIMNSPVLEAYRPQDVYIGTYLGLLEALDAGVTTVLDWAHVVRTAEQSDEAIRAHKEAGTRAVFACGFFDQNTERIKQLQAKHFSSRDQRVTLALAIGGGTAGSHLEQTQKDIFFGRELGVLISMHIGIGIWGPQSRAIEVLHQANLLGPDLNFVHCNTLNETEYRLIAETGGSVSCTPEVEMQMGHGFPQIGKLLQYGIRPSLGADVVVSTSGDLFTQMRFALQTERALTNKKILKQGIMPQRLTLTVQDVLEFSTIDGARALRLDHQIGSITPGKEADLILLRTADLNMIPGNNPIGSVVLCCNPSNVDSVFVAGKAVKRNGALLNIDLEHIRRLALESRDYLISKWQAH